MADLESNVSGVAVNFFAQSEKLAEKELNEEGLPVTVEEIARRAHGIRKDLEDNHAAGLANGYADFAETMGTMDEVVERYEVELQAQEIIQNSPASDVSANLIRSMRRGELKTATDLARIREGESIELLTDDEEALIPTIQKAIQERKGFRIARDLTTLMTQGRLHTDDDLERVQASHNEPAPEVGADIQEKGVQFLRELRRRWEDSGHDPLPKAVTEIASLENVEFTKKQLTDVHELAKKYAIVGEIADYIPALARIIENGNAERAGITIVDGNDDLMEAGEGAEISASAQSTIKPFLFLYALYKGTSAHEIAGVEPTAKKFNDDPSLDLSKVVETAEHPLNNAGGISSAGVIGNDFNGFLNFMRVLTGNSSLAVDEKVYKSEKRCSAGNRTISHALELRGRFGGESEAKLALDNYTRACAINVTRADLGRAYQVIGSGGKKKGKQILDQDICIPVMAAMNSFGLYDLHAAMTLLEAGSTALTAKSGVSGFVVNVMPNGLVSVTWSPYLDSAGNSLYSMIVGSALNLLLAGESTIPRFSDEEIDERLREYIEEQIKKIIESKRLQPDKDDILFKIPEEALLSFVLLSVKSNLQLLQSAEQIAMVLRKLEEKPES